MPFDTWTFLVFLLVTLGVYYGLERRWQNVWLLVASYFFYGWWDWRFLGLIAISTCIDYAVARRMEFATSEVQRRWLLYLSLGANLGILAFFKYFNFFIEPLRLSLHALGVSFASPALVILLPVGISFYTFQTMAYTIDVYRRETPPCKGFVTFAVYVCYFPQLVAGPIERASRLIPCLEGRRVVTGDTLLSGLFLMLVGFFKKIAIADYLAGFVESVFAAPEGCGSLKLLVALYCFALQIYCDFSGYTDIARGVSRLLGIELMVNFRQPYLSSSITEFWRRWHISLSTWLRDYLYIPLGGNRRGRLKTYRNLLLTMLLGGLWHGASWTFVVWGGLHGVYLAIHRLWREGRGRPTGGRARLPSMLGGFVTFHLVCFAWIFFRSRSFAVAARYLSGLVALRSGEGLVELLTALHMLLSATLMWLLVDASKRWCERRARRFVDLPAWQMVLFGSALVSLLLVFGDRVNAPFIYFQF